MTQNIKNIILLTIFIILISTVVSHAAGEAEISVSTSGSAISVGDVIQVDINLNNNPGISAMQFELYFNSDAFEYNSVSYGSITDNCLKACNVKNGKLIFAAAATQSINFDGTIVSVTFIARQSNTPFNYNFSKVMLADEKGNTIDTKYYEEKLSDISVELVVPSQPVIAGESFNVYLSIYNNPGITELSSHLNSALLDQCKVYNKGTEYTSLCNGFIKSGEAIKSQYECHANGIFIVYKFIAAEDLDQFDFKASIKAANVSGNSEIITANPVTTTADIEYTLLNQEAILIYDQYNAIASTVGIEPLKIMVGKIDNSTRILATYYADGKLSKIYTADDSEDYLTFKVTDLNWKHPTFKIFTLSSSYISSISTLSCDRLTFKHSYIDTTDHWAESYISEAILSGWIDEPEGDYFYPDENVTKEQFIVSIWKMHGSQSCSAASNFNDVNSLCAESVKAINWAYSMNAFTYFDEDLLQPTENITREDVCKILYEINGGTPGPEQVYRPIYDAGFTDSTDLSESTKDAMYWAYYNGIIGESADDKLNPDGNLTKAQMAKIYVTYNDFSGNL